MSKKIVYALIIKKLKDYSTIVKNIKFCEVSITILWFFYISAVPQS